MNVRKVSGVRIIIDTTGPCGTPLNDSPLEDRNALSEPEDDDREMVCVDQMTQVVTLEYMEKRDRMDRHRYSF